MPDRLHVTIDDARAKMQAAWREKRLGYQLPGVIGCHYRYYDDRGKVIGCCAVGAVIPDELVWRPTDGRACARGRIPIAAALSRFRELFDADDATWSWLRRSQNLHDAAVRWRQIARNAVAEAGQEDAARNAAIAAADFERHIGVLPVENGCGNG